MPATGAFQTYDSFVQYQATGVIDLEDDTFKAALFLSTSNAADLTKTVLADLTNEHAAANGYAAGGFALTGVTLTRAGRVLKWDANDLSFTAAGGPITARYLVIYKVGTVGAVTNPLVGVCLLDPAPADVTVNDGNTGTVQFPAAGVLTIS